MCSAAGVYIMTVTHAFRGHLVPSLTLASAQSLHYIASMRSLCWLYPHNRPTLTATSPIEGVKAGTGDTLTPIDYQSSRIHEIVYPKAWQRLAYILRQCLLRRSSGTVAMACSAMPNCRCTYINQNAATR